MVPVLECVEPAVLVASLERTTLPLTAITWRESLPLVVTGELVVLASKALLLVAF